MSQFKIFRDTVQDVVSGIQAAIQPAQPGNSKGSGGASRASTSQRGSSSRTGATSEARGSGSRGGSSTLRGGTGRTRTIIREYNTPRVGVATRKDDRRRTQGVRVGSTARGGQTAYGGRTERTSRPQTTRRSGVPPHQSGSYLSLNASSAKKRELLEQELRQISEEKNGATGLKQRDELAKREQNVIHQLRTLDAAVGGEPKQYTSGSTDDAAGKKATVTKDTATETDAAKKAKEAANNVPDVRAFGAGKVMTMEDEQRRVEQEQAEIEERYQKNLAIEQANIASWLDDTGHVNGQARDVLGSMSFGQTIDEAVSDPAVNGRLHKINDKFTSNDFGTVANAGCEAIAVYNTLHDLGKDVSLSQIIYDTERNGYMLWNGWFGTKTSKVDDMLRQYGVESSITSNVDFIEKFAKEGAIKEGQIYVASAYNGPGRIFSGIHTFEIVYLPSKNPQEPWVAYNLTSDTEAEAKATFQEIFSGAPIQINKIEMGREK